MEQISLDWQPRRRILSVTELNFEIRSTLAKSFADLWVSGEVSGLKIAPSGHAYFTLKDARSQIRCVCFKSTLRLIKFRPRDGMAALARGRIEVYEARGDYQFLIDWLEPQGAGALQLAFEQLKQKLEAEGLFASDRKRPLPRFPRRIGIVTSPSGAAIRDMLNILDRRHPGLHIRVYPALVQGDGSVQAVTAGIEYFSRTPWADVVIVGRGGGSLEDLWTFNEESVARAIARCAVPVISAVGHETDVTIADFTADLRAATPSAAAELVIAPKLSLCEQVDALRRRAERCAILRLAQASSRVHQQGIHRANVVLHRRIARISLRVDDLENRTREIIRRQVAARKRKLDALDARLRRQDARVKLAEARRRLTATVAASERAIEQSIVAARRRWEALAAGLAQLSPVRILERGYAIVDDGSGSILRQSSQVHVGQDIGVRLWRGRLRGKVIEVQGE